MDLSSDRWWNYPSSDVHITTACRPHGGGGVSDHYSLSMDNDVAGAEGGKSGNVF